VGPALLADVILVVHLGYVLFVLVGLALIWLGVWLEWGWVRRPPFRLAHLVCTLIVPIEALSGVLCPLTTWEHELRLAAGQAPEQISFVGRLARDVLFYEAPPWVFTVCYVAFGLLVVATLVLVPIRRAPRAAGVEPEPVP
jgi:hypothetical protein